MPVLVTWFLWDCNPVRQDRQLGKYGRFPFNKNSGLKFRKFYVFNGTVHSGCTDPTQATARLVIVLASRIQKSGTGDNNFVKASPEYSGRTKPKWSVLFDVATEITGILGWMESALLFISKKLRWCYTKRFATTIFSATQRWASIAGTMLWPIETLCCPKNRRCDSFRVTSLLHSHGTGRNFERLKVVRLGVSFSRNHPNVRKFRRRAV